MHISPAARSCGDFLCPFADPGRDPAHWAGVPPTARGREFPTARSAAGAPFDGIDSGRPRCGLPASNAALAARRSITPWRLRRRKEMVGPTVLPPGGRNLPSCGPRPQISRPPQGCFPFRGETPLSGGFGMTIPQAAGRPDPFTQGSRIWCGSAAKKKAPFRALPARLRGIKDGWSRFHPSFPHRASPSISRAARVFSASRARRRALRLR